MPKCNEEYRAMDEIELRVVEREGKLPILEGTALPYNSRSQLLYNAFYEQFAVGALRDFINDKPDVFALIQHDWNKVMGRTLADTLTLKEDDKGVHFVIDPPNTSFSRDLIESVKRKEVRGMSFAFYNVTDEWTMHEGKELRTIKKAKIREITFTPNPAYTSTEIMTRSLQTLMEDHNEMLQRNMDMMKNMQETMKMKLASLEMD